MAGLYNVVFGENDFGQALVAILNDVQPIDVGRYRDAWVEREDKLVIRIHTRNGGGNREDYAQEIESMQNHPWYDHDTDDSFDSTYADFYFSVPESLEGNLRQGIEGIANDPVDMPARWQQVIEGLKNA